MILPQLNATFVCAWLVCVAFAMGEVSASILVVPPGMSTLSQRIFNLVHYGVEDRLAGICLSSLAIFLMCAFGTTKIYELRIKNESP